jgi:hypothetical protein
VEPDDLDHEIEEEFVEEDELDEISVEFVEKLVDKIMNFMDVFTNMPLHNYQKPFARRIIESVIIGDGEELTGLAARQSGKSQILASVVTTLMVLLPKLAILYPDLLGKYKNGFWVGIFAPTETQAETLFGRAVSMLTSDHAIQILGDPEIDDSAGRLTGVTKGIRLKKSGSAMQMMTANPRAKIESKTYHIILVDECQEADDRVVDKSISPMRASTNGTMVKTGTPTYSKNNFYRSIQNNKRRQTSSRSRQHHFQWDWKEVVKENPDYGKFIKKEMVRIGEDSDEFQLSYCCRFLLERGMFVTSTAMDELADTSMEVVRSWFQSPVVVGIDPARKTDSTVVTVVGVDWDRPDEFGYYDHVVLNWLELQGEDWEEQYFQIQNFLSQYDVLAVAVDANGVGDAVAQRLKRLLPRAEVVPLTSSQSEQSKRWKHLQALIQRKMLSFPAHAKTRRLRTYKRFYQQMTDLETKYTGPNFLAQAPEEAHAHDDYADSLALACVLTADLTMPSIEISDNVLYR